MLYKDRLKNFAFFVTVFIRIMKTGSTQSRDISPPPYVYLNPVIHNFGSVQAEKDGREGMWFKQHAVIEFPTAKISSHIHCVWTECMGESHVDVSIVRCGYGSLSKKKWGKQVCVTEQGWRGHWLQQDRNQKLFKS